MTIFECLSLGEIISLHPSHHTPTMMTVLCHAREALKVCLSPMPPSNPKIPQSAPCHQNEGEIQHLNEVDRFPILISQYNPSHNYLKVDILPLTTTVPNRQASCPSGPCHLNLAQVTLQAERTHLISILRIRLIRWM